MNYVEISGTDYEVKCEHNKHYDYFIRHNHKEEWNIGSINKSPLELSEKTTVGKVIYKYLKQKSYSAKNDEERDELRYKDFRLILKELEMNVETAQAVAEQEELEGPTLDKDHYMGLYSKYITRRDEYGLSDLQFLGQICQGAGVGSADIVLKMYITFLETVLGIKATNVIAIGGPSSGKTHSMEKALEMIPNEYVIKGVHSEAYFFGKFNGRDLSRHVFYLGDLGGDMDDQKTIVTRDILKQLNTDGFVSRGIAPDSEPRDEVVYGNPAIAYTTANEEIINDQEKARSDIFKPPSINEDKLAIYNAVYDSPGKDYVLIKQIQSDIESVKGLTWYLIENVDNYEMFNPYMFSISEFLKNMDDFNRKIKEFNKVLLIVALLNNPFVLKHDMYYDEDYERIETKLIITSKQDVLNALMIFDGSSNLLPTELALLKGLAKKYRPYPLEDAEEYSVRDFEETLLKDEKIFDVDDRGNISGWDTGYDVDYFGDDITEWNQKYNKQNPNTIYCFFTVTTIRRSHATQKWYKDIKSNLSDKLRKLYEYNFLIKIGKVGGENIYGLAPNVDALIDMNVPTFTQTRLNMGMQEFKRKYPSLYPQFEKFVREDKRNRGIKAVDFDIKESELYDVPWATVPSSQN